MCVSNYVKDGSDLCLLYSTKTSTKLTSKGEIWVMLEPGLSVFKLISPTVA